MADKLKIEKIDGVQVLNAGGISYASLELTPHHLILTEAPPLSPLGTSPPKRIANPRQSWIALPMISLCTYRPVPPSSGQKSSIRLRFRDFRFITFNFREDKHAKDMFEALKSQTCKLRTIEKLHAFSYIPIGLEKTINGWEVYDAKAEWRRQGISDKGVDRGWRISKINVDYAFSPTYPALLPVPSTISDNTLNYAGRYRSRVRIPVLTYLHPVNNCSITRSSQPLAGLRGNRSIQDEKLVSACFTASPPRGDSAMNSSTTSRASPASSQVDIEPPIFISEGELSETERLEDEMISSSTSGTVADKPLIYGAQQHNLIVDARPTVNALAMQAIGLGSEDMNHYNFATKAYLGIDNIHVMRKSLATVVEAIRDSDISKLPPDRAMLLKSNWLGHITGLLDGSALIARQVGIQHSHVLIHCSDGWDRTSQLSALAQLMLDPYYRTIDGFIVLVEKDWLAFGHMFQLRSGHLNSDKWFKAQNDALAGSAIQPGGNSEGRGDAIENALLSAKRFFNKSTQPADANSETDGDLDDVPKSKRSSKDNSSASKEATDTGNLSPVFHQFLDATYQLLHQYPTRFEFNERFLRRLLYHLYSCQYGTFLYNNEKSRLDAKVYERTQSVWAYFLSRRGEFTNQQYDGGSIDDHIKGRERLLFPKLEKVRWWNEVFNRTDEEMNGRAGGVVIPRSLSPGVNAGMGGSSSVGVGRSVLTGVESANATVATPQKEPSSSSTTSLEGSSGATTPKKNPSNGDLGRFASLREGIAGLGIGRGAGLLGIGRGTSNAAAEMTSSKSPAGSGEMGVEMKSASASGSVSESGSSSTKPVVIGGSFDGNDEDAGETVVVQEAMTNTQGESESELSVFKAPANGQVTPAPIEEKEPEPPVIPDTHDPLGVRNFALDT